MGICPSYFSSITAVVAGAAWPWRAREGKRMEIVVVAQGSAGKAPSDQGSMFLGGSEGISSIWRSFLVGLSASPLAKPHRREPACS